MPDNKLDKSPHQRSVRDRIGTVRDKKIYLEKAGYEAKSKRQEPEKRPGRRLAKRQEKRPGGRIRRNQSECKLRGQEEARRED
jgi:hypothetical protein